MFGGYQGIITKKDYRVGIIKWEALTCTKIMGGDYSPNHKNFNFLDCDWFKKLLFSTNSLTKFLSDSSISQPHSKL